MKKHIDKALALKLINQYADNYRRLEDEKLSLQKEMKDLQSNLSVNKNVIDILMKEQDVDMKIRSLLALNKEEMDVIMNSNALLKKENSSLRIKVLEYEATITNSIAHYKECKELLELRVFTLENSNKKKDYQLKSLLAKHKLTEEKNKKYYYHNEANEVYVTDPSESLTIMYSDLLLYKEGYENALAKIKEVKAEIARLRKIHYCKDSPDKKGEGKVSIEALNEMLAKCQRKTWETDEWLSILSYLQITHEDIDKNTPNGKFFSKLFEAIELLNKVVIQRNYQLTQAMRTNDTLKEETKDLKNENLRLFKHLMNLKKQNGFTKDEVGDSYINTNISMVNNLDMGDNCKNGIDRGCDGLMQSMHSKSVTLENSMNQTEPSYLKSFNYTQVTENSFDIAEANHIKSSVQKNTSRQKQRKDNSN